jgi:hypothetical protein
MIRKYADSLGIHLNSEAFPKCNLSQSCIDIYCRKGTKTYQNLLNLDSDEIPISVCVARNLIICKKIT